MTFDVSIRMACIEIVNAADEYDSGIRIALACWEDMMYPSMRDSDTDLEAGKDAKEEDLEVARKLRKKHRRKVIKSMRNRCLEGIENRKRMSSQMQWMLNDVIARYVFCSIGTEEPRLIEFRENDLPHAMSERPPAPSTSSEIHVQNSLYAINGFRSFYIADFDFEREKEETDEVRPATKESSIIVSRTKPLSLLAALNADEL